MLDLRWVENNLEEAKARLGLRGKVAGLDELIKLIEARRELILHGEALKRQRNEANDRLKGGDKAKIEEMRDEMRKTSDSIKASDAKLAAVEQELNNLALLVPNLPRADVPQGKGEEDNPVVKVVGEPPQFNFAPRDHIELGAMTDTIDMERAAKISGSRFAFLKGQGARLNRALLQFFTDFHVAQGDTELAPPYMVREQAMVGAGSFPKFVEDAFKVSMENDQPYFLIPTAEVPVTNYLADEILDENSLPQRYCAYSACFRSEAGAGGRDTKGMIRLHQFEKVEMVRFVKPEQAMPELQLMVERASKLLSMLELPHRVVELCTGDLGFHSEKTFDLEVFLPGQNAYREISSCSSFASFQARRAKIRYKVDGKTEMVCTLNGSGLPLGRTLVAIYENHQQADGSIKIPTVLQAFMGGEKVIRVR
jgi:seryl-tRNA synthetase